VLRQVQDAALLGVLKVGRLIERRADDRGVDSGVVLGAVTPGDRDDGLLDEPLGLAEERRRPALVRLRAVRDEVGKRRLP
jgi:hypothetical protein